MKKIRSIQSFPYLTLASLAFLSLKPQLEASLPESLTIEVKNVLQWDTSSGQTYQLQKSTNPNSWENIATAGEEIGNQYQQEIATIEPGTEYRVVKTVTGHYNDAAWKDFDSSGDGGAKISGSDTYEFTGYPAWDGFYNTETSIYPLEFSNIGAITFDAYVPNGSDANIRFVFERLPYNTEGNNELSTLPNYETPKKLISGNVLTEYTIPVPSQGTKTFSSFIFYLDANDPPIVLRNVRVQDDSTVEAEEEILELDPLSVTQVSWQSLNGVEYDVMESSNLVDWSDSGTDVLGDGSTKTVTMTMDQASRFIRVIRPDYELFAPTDPTTQPSLIENALDLRWNPSTTPTVVGYRVYYGTNYNNLNQTIDVSDGNSVTIENLIPETTYFFAVVSIDISDEQSDLSAAQVSGEAELLSFVPLFNEDTVLEDPSVINDTALITRGSDRGRSRHAREGQFQRYDLYETGYWDGRAYYFEIIDRVGYDSNQGGNWSSEYDDTITINMMTQYPLTSASEMRSFWVGGNVYSYNFDATGRIDPNTRSYGRRKVDGTLEFHNPDGGSYETNPLDSNAPLHYYTHTLKPSHPNTGDMGIDDLFEFELSQFGLPINVGGINNYYGTAFLYKVGTGLVPWHGVGAANAAEELPVSARLGGGLTHHEQLSNEPYHAFKQMAYNLSHNNAQKFMDGRRLHHTEFSNGVHSEPGNPNFNEHANQLGPKFVNASCVECHTNNGRAIPNDPGELMDKSIVRVGLDSSGSHHDAFKSVLQIAGEDLEMRAYRDNYEIIEGQYGDGTNYTLRKPTYSFSGEYSRFLFRSFGPAVSWTWTSRSH